MVEDLSDPRSGRPATRRPPENIEHVQAAVNKDFWLFPKLKSPLKGKRFLIVDKIEEYMRQLMVILTKDFAECFE